MHGHSLASDPDSLFLTVCLSVCVFLCSDDNDTKCQKLIRASLSGKSGLWNVCTLYSSVGSYVVEKSFVSNVIH